MQDIEVLNAISQTINGLGSVGVLAFFAIGFWNALRAQMDARIADLKQAKDEHIADLRKVITFADEDAK